MKHTKTPFEVFTRFNGGTKELMIVDSVEHEGDLIATLSDHLRAEGDAAFIVKACNAHENLLIVVKGYRELLNVLPTHHYPPDLKELLDDVIDKAEGES